MSPSQCLAYTGTGILNMGEDGLSGASGARRAAGMKPVTADTAGKARSPPVGLDHAAIAAGKDEERHQVICEIAIPKMRLESKEIGIPMGSCTWSRQRSALP